MTDCVNRSQHLNLRRHTGRVPNFSLASLKKRILKQRVNNPPSYPKLCSQTYPNSQQNRDSRFRRWIPKSAFPSPSIIPKPAYRADPRRKSEARETETTADVTQLDREKREKRGWDARNENSTSSSPLLVSFLECRRLSSLSLSLTFICDTQSVSFNRKSKSKKSLRTKNSCIATC